MSVSGITEYEATGATIVKNAFRHIRVSQKGQPLRADDASFGLELLNGIVKSWQRDGLHLWKNKEAAVFLETGRRTYALGANAGIACDQDGCNADDIAGQTVYATSGDWVNTTTTAAATTATDTISIASLTSYAGITYNTTCAMNIGIENINGGMDWYSIAGVSGLDITLPINLVTDVPIDATVYIYRENDQLEKPLKIEMENVRLLQNSANYELPIHLLAWTEYNLLPDKSVTGVPVQAFYEPRINNTELAIWPTSATVENILLFRFQSPLNIFEEDTDTQDFPAEWIRPLEWALASELGPSYGVPLQRQGALDSRAASLKDAVTDWDQDNTSLFIQPRSWGSL